MLVRYLIALWLITSRKSSSKSNGMYFLALNCTIHGHVLVAMHNRNTLPSNTLVTWCYVDSWSHVKAFIEICGSAYAWTIADASKDITPEGCS